MSGVRNATRRPVPRTLELGNNRFRLHVFCATGNFGNRRHRRSVLEFTPRCGNELCHHAADRQGHLCHLRAPADGDLCDTGPIAKFFGDSSFTNAASTTGTGTITYASDKSAVATVNASTGEVTIKGAGTATITATAAETAHIPRVRQATR